MLGQYTVALNIRGPVSVRSGDAAYYQMAARVYSEWSKNVAKTSPEDRGQRLNLIQRGPRTCPRPGHHPIRGGPVSQGFAFPRHARADSRQTRTVAGSREGVGICPAIAAPKSSTHASLAEAYRHLGLEEIVQQHGNLAKLGQKREKTPAN